MHNRLSLHAPVQRAKRAQSLVELAVTLPLMALLLLGCFDTTMLVWDKLIAGEWVDKPAAKAGTAYIGVVFPEDDEEDAWLREVESDGPADKGGLRAGDTITKFNESPVKSVKQFRKLMEGAKPGDKVKLTVRRGTDVVTLTVTLGKRA